MSNIFFIGDLHLGHTNILQFGQRPFDDIDTHDLGLMERWNSVVTSMRDIVWVLGDVAMSLEAMRLLVAFNGQKRLILGNHDNFPLAEYQLYFDSIHAFEKRYHGLVLTHIPIHPGELSYRNWEYNVHGHCHHPDKAPKEPQYINVNADVRNLTPVPLDVIRDEIIQRKLEEIT